jgi:(p)ppGpp synthase/HD superfamily hydrolase
VSDGDRAPVDPPPRLGERFDAALAFARALHGDQRRKKSGIPYMAHLMAVAAIVLEHDGDEDQAIAALLHDGPEDQGGRATLDEIGRRFGARVAAIVEACTDTLDDPKPPWRARKEAYLAHLDHAPAAALLVSLADKVHNCRTILYDYRDEGELLWRRFTGGRDQTLWYYRALAGRFRALIVGPLRSLVDELERILAALEDEVSARTPP